MVVLIVLHVIRKEESGQERGWICMGPIGTLHLFVSGISIIPLGHTLVLDGKVIGNWFDFHEGKR